MELTPDEAIALYDCLMDDLREAYAQSGNEHAMAFLGWPRYSTQPYVSATHGGRYVHNYANETASAYGDFEEAGEMPVGSVAAKDSFQVTEDGQGVIGPLFLMEKMEPGWHEESDDWRYTLITPAGDIAGTTRGEGADNVEFCIQCHKAGSAPDVDSLLFLPEDLRVQ